MKTSIVGREAYFAAHGSINSRPGNAVYDALWLKLRESKLNEVVLIEPDKGDRLESLRATIYGAMGKRFKSHQGNPLLWRFRCVLRKSEKHVVLFKVELSPEAKAIAARKAAA